MVGPELNLSALHATPDSILYFIFSMLRDDVIAAAFGAIATIIVGVCVRLPRERKEAAATERSRYDAATIYEVLKENIALQGELEDLIHEGDRLATENRELRRELRELKSKARRDLVEELAAPLTSDDARALLEQVIAARKNRGDPQ